MVTETIDKKKLVEMLKAQITALPDNSNDARFVYQCGRNSIATYLLMEIAFGTLDQ